MALGAPEFYSDMACVSNDIAQLHGQPARAAGEPDTHRPQPKGRNRNGRKDLRQLTAAPYKANLVHSGFLGKDGNANGCGRQSPKHPPLCTPP